MRYVQTIPNSISHPTSQIIEVHNPDPIDKRASPLTDPGRTVFRRLYLIASCSKVLGEEAARLAVAEAKRRNDVVQYHDAVSLLRHITGGGDPSSDIDTAWVERKEKQNQAETQRLELELKGYKNNLIKESIRVSLYCALSGLAHVLLSLTCPGLTLHSQMGNEDLCSHYYAIGDLVNALKAASRMREFCTTPAHIASTAFKIIHISIEQQNWLAVQSQVHKIRNLQMKPEDAARSQPKQFAAMGLQQMDSGDFREAAVSFLMTDASLGESYNEVLTSNDVAVYGGLCALASMTRTELQTKVLEDANFRNFLELEPHIRRAINFFCSAKYSQCLEILKSYRADYLLDIYLQPHYEKIVQDVRTKSIVEYLRPFSRVTLDNLEQVFGQLETRQAVTNGTAQTNGSTNGHSSWGDTPSIVDELITLIESGQLHAKIDMIDRVVIADTIDEREDLHFNTLKMLDEFTREARLRMLRMSYINAGLEVKAPRKTGGRKAGWSDNTASTGATTDDLPESYGNAFGGGSDDEFADLDDGNEDNDYELQHDDVPGFVGKGKSVLTQQQQFQQQQQQQQQSSSSSRASGRARGKRSADIVAAGVGDYATICRVTELN